MQLILELLKKIFVALQGVYTKQETDAALAEIDLQWVIDAQSSRNVVMNNILTIAKTPVDNVHPLLLMGDFSSRIGSVNTTTGQISGFVNETMPQDDGTFVVTNRVSGGPLELSEDGAAPNHAVSLCQLTAEAQAREEADAKQTWYGFMMEKAVLTNDAKNIAKVNRAMLMNSEDVLPARMIEDWKFITEHEQFCQIAGAESPFDVDFWVTYFRELSAFEANPADITWDSSNHPYASVKPANDSWVINFNVVDIRAKFASGTNCKLYLPRLVYFDVGEAPLIQGSSLKYTPIFPALKGKASASRIVSSNQLISAIYQYPRLDTVVSVGIISGSRSITSAFVSFPLLSDINEINKVGAELGYNTAPAENLITAVASAPKFKRPVFSLTYSPKISKITYLGGLPCAIYVNELIASSVATSNPITLSFGDDWAGDLRFPAALYGTNFAKNRLAFNQVVLLPSLHTGDDAFLNAGMSAANISAVLDSLPSDPVAAGGTGVITFTGCPGAAELTQDSPSVAAAIAKGWEVRL
jgi:hypothetical protein